MATYQELADLTSDTGWGGLLQKIRVASTIKAAAIIDSTTPTAAALEWAKVAISDPVSAGDGVAFYVVASNSGAALPAILGASDAAIQNNVNSAVDAIYGN